MRRNWAAFGANSRHGKNECMLSYSKSNFTDWIVCTRTQTANDYDNEHQHITQCALAGRFFFFAYMVCAQSVRKTSDSADETVNREYIRLMMQCQYIVLLSFSLIANLWVERQTIQFCFFSPFSFSIYVLPLVVVQLYEYTNCVNTANSRLISF